MGRRAVFPVLLLLAMPSLAAVTEPRVPPRLRAAADEAPAFMLTGNGAYVYECKPSSFDANAYVWVFVVPDANLYDGSHLAARHTSIDVYEAVDDRNSVTGILIAAATAGRDNLPWALFRARALSDTGLFAGVTSFQRVNTGGGAPPRTGCDADHGGAEARQNFTADYYFYRKRAAQ